MARRNGMGPEGMGAMTGRGLGACGAGMNPGMNAPMYGGGYGGRGGGCRRGSFRGAGRGLGFEFGVNANDDYGQASSKEMLEAQKDQLKNALDHIDKQLDEL